MSTKEIDNCGTNVWQISQNIEVSKHHDMSCFKNGTHTVIKLNKLLELLNPNKSSSIPYCRTDWTGSTWEREL